MKYSEERKEAVLHKLLPPQSQSVEQVSAAEGISRATPGGTSPGSAGTRRRLGAGVVESRQVYRGGGDQCSE